MVYTCQNSTTAKISDFIQRQKNGTTFVYDDFKELGSYSNIRSSIVRLCKKKELTKLYHGIYMKSGDKIPDAVHIALEIGRKKGLKVSLRRDKCYGNTRIISLYTNGSTRNIILSDGTVLKYFHINCF